MVWVSEFVPVHIPFYKIFNIYTRHSVNKFPGKLILITLFLFFNEEWFVIRHWQPIYSSLLSQSECTTFDIHKLKETIYTKKKTTQDIPIFNTHLHLNHNKNEERKKIRRRRKYADALIDCILYVYSNWFCIHQQ